MNFIKSLIFGLFLASVSVSAFSQDYDCDTRDKLKNLPNNPYPHIECFHEGLAGVSDENYENNGFIDKVGKLVIPRIYTYTRPFSEGLALVSQGQHQFFIDKSGKTVIDLTGYNQAWDFENGLAKVSKNDVSSDPFLTKQGYIDKTGKVVIPLDYLEIDKFRDGKALAIKYSLETGSKMGMINLNNEPIIPFNYSFLYGFKDGLSVAVKDCDMLLAQFGDDSEYKKCHFGTIDEQNHTVIPFEYQFIEGFKNGVSVAIKNDKIGKIDKQGNVIEKFVPKPKAPPKKQRNYI